jgi:hypothetical protein
MRYLAVLLIGAGALTACGSHAVRHVSPGPPTNSRVERCVARLVAGSDTSVAGKEQTRHYIRDSYCRPFEQRGWVYDDGALKLAAYLSVQNGGSCVPRALPASRRRWCHASSNEAATAS